MDVMGSAEMSKRAHFWIRLAAVVVIAAAAAIPRGFTSGSSASMPAGESRSIQASVTAR
jgi:hypothetical protein